jgi:uncharacterized membrane protein YeaQ/YmgE (transglycosylase-associated protein family)
MGVFWRPPELQCHASVSRKDLAGEDTGRPVAVGWDLMTISLVGLLILLLIAGLCGAVGRAIAGGTNGGCLVSIALGFIGALIGSWLAHRLRLPELFAITVGREHFPVLWSIIGAALFVALVHLLSGGRR